MLDTKIFTLESRDFLEMEQALSAWDHQYEQFSSGAFRGSLFHTQTGSLEIFRNRWERTLHYRGVAPQGTIGVGITLIQTGEGRWMGQPMAFDDVFVSRCGMEGEYISAPFWDSVVLAIPEDKLAQQITNITQEDPEQLLHTHGVVRPTPQLATRLRQTCIAYLNAAAWYLARPDAVSLLLEKAKSMLKLIAYALVFCRPLLIKKKINRQRQLIRKAEEYSLRHPDQLLRIGRLSGEIGVPERSLRDAFHNLTDVGPLDYLKNQRLNRVYRTLRDSDPNEVLVKQVAYSNGFTHLGQFCGDYKQLFGELPSDTLQRGLSG